MLLFLLAAASILRVFYFCFVVFIVCASDLIWIKQRACQLLKSYVNQGFTVFDKQVLRCFSTKVLPSAHSGVTDR